MINRTLDDRYTLLECVGSGGMADVYRAHDKLLDRSVAVKILHPQFNNDDEFITRFQREAQAAARLSHPNIVNIYDVGKDQDVDYIVMEYISGETLKQRIQRLGPLPTEMAVFIATEIAEALENAHQNKIIHCDIKPHNILITRTGRVKVTDFGIARAATSATMTQTGTILGSVHYFSPEQAKGVMITEKSDIYSLGIVIYEMLTGNVPFTGETPISIALKHLQEEVRPPRELNPDIPPVLDMIVVKSLAKNPEERYANMEGLIADLQLAQSYSRDQHTKRLSKDDYPTQVLPKMTDVESGQTGGSSRKLSFTSRWGIIALLGLLVLGFGLGAFLAFGKFWVASEIAVPNVVGKHAETARNMLEEANLRVTQTDAFNDKVPLGYVISQSPEAGATVKEQRTVTIVVSRGGEIASVPDVRGLNRRDAELQLKNAGLVVGKVEEVYSADAAPETVINQNPRPPVQISKGSSVDLSLSKGPEPRKISLPDFRGASLNAAVTQLETLKLKLGKVTEEQSDKYPSGTISNQTPLPGAEVEANSTVDLSVAKNNIERSIRQVSIQVDVPQGPIRQSVQIVATDANGREVVYEGVHKPGEHIEKTLEVSSPVRIQVYINNSLQQEKTF
ncbi:MAG: Stk1 family PASTA domain-containing Ser/Thr kinase [Sporomusaceae bacterium]|nr:Stk1 family PASTA domain-containing Ser/Thr kinase [Sporomusaceae bacterium]